MVLLIRIVVLCALLFGPGMIPFTLAESRPTFVDLSSSQTGLRNQGSRGTCITFAAIAALEAAYKRAGYGDVDLSEQFLNHTGKMFWLHANWEEILAGGEDGGETQVGAYGGGGGAGYIRALAHGLKVPIDAVMPYRSTEYTAADHPHLAHPWDDPFWHLQRRKSDFNLDPRFLPPDALKADKYYAVKTYRDINPKSAADIEAALVSGKEVVWDFRVANTQEPIWRPCRSGQAGCPGGGHSMLIIGYDRRDPNPINHYFLVKNSWGSTSNPGGYTRIAYDYLQYGSDAVSIEQIEEPQRWEELALVGRWKLNFDGWKGELDIYHLPGIAQFQLGTAGVTTQDRRIGTFYDINGKAFKVNGNISGRYINFYIDSSNPNARWDQIGGRSFSYTLVRAAGDMMAGEHRDPDGRIYGGYARKYDFLPSGLPTSRPLHPASYLGQWAVEFNTSQGTLVLAHADNSFLSPTEKEVYSGLTGEYFVGSQTYVARALVDKEDPNTIIIHIPAILGNPGREGGRLYGQHLNHEHGVVAGTARFKSVWSGSDGILYGFVMIKTNHSGARYRIFLPFTNR